MSKEDIHGRTNHKNSYSDPRVHPQNVGIARDGNEGQRNGAPNSHCQQIKTLNETFQPGRRVSIGVLGSRRVDEERREAEKDVERGLHRNVDVIWQNLAILLSRRTRQWFIVARPCVVYEVLDDGCVRDTKADGGKADGDTLNRAENDAMAPQDGKDNPVNDGQKQQNSNSLKTPHKVVGDITAFHLASLGDEVR